MNLYRSFGNLMEAWVSEGGQCSDSEWLGNNDDDSPTSSGTNLRSESVDSGVETASSDASFPAISCSVSTDNTEMEIFTPERENNTLTPASTSQSPVLSSPAPSLSSFSSVRLCPSTLQQKVEQAILRTESKHLKEKTEPLTADVVLRRRPWASFQTKRHTSEIVRSQRSESFGPRKTVDPLVHTSQIYRQPMSVSCVKPPVQRRSEDLGEEEVNGLSPGLYYLEQVCQMLEEIARQQMPSQVLQMDMNALQECQEESQALNACQNDFKAAEEVHSSCPKLENAENAECSSSEPQRRKNYTHFRQRSASDTTIATLHLRKLNVDCRGQHLSTDNILERVEENHEMQELKKEDVNKSTSKSWKLKFGSLGRDFSVREIWGQQKQSSEKNSARRRLSQLFRKNRRKTLPVYDDQL